MVLVYLHFLRILYNFYFQLEKEALVKGVPIGQALDIDIPPPRPKRKPINPYPRKTSVGAPTLHSGAKDGKNNPVESSHVKQAFDLEKVPLPEVNISILIFIFHFVHIFFSLFQSNNSACLSFY